MITFEQVSLEVEKLYSQDLKEDPKAIEEQCLLIENFIEACGWSLDSFVEKSLVGSGN
jgi:hypothetical protein